MVFSDEGTRQGRDEQPGGKWIVLRMLRVLEPHHIPRVLDHHMLEPSTGSEEGPVELAGEPNAVEGTRHALVGTPGGAQERIEPPKLLPNVLFQRRSRYPSQVNINSQMGRRVAKSIIRRLMRQQAWIVVANHAQLKRFRHASERGSISKKLAVDVCINSP